MQPIVPVALPFLRPLVMLFTERSQNCIQIRFIAEFVKLAGAK